MHSKSNEFPVAMLLVAMDAPTSGRIVHAASQKHWATSFFEQEQYPSETRRPSFRSQISPSAFCVAFIDFDSSAEQAARAARYLQDTAPAGITLVAVAGAPEPDTILMAMRSGCTEFLRKPQAEAELPVLMDRLEQLSIQTERETSAPGTVLSLMGVKGGVGATTVAVQLATAISKVYGKRTLLVDAQPELGHACVYLGLDAKNSQFGDVVHNVTRLDSELLRGLVAQHSSGLHVLSSPDKWADPVAWDYGALVRALTFLRSEYEYIVVDCPVADGELSLAVMETSSQIYLVGTPEIGAIRDLSRHADRLMLMDSITDKLKIVLNRSVAQFDTGAAQIERVIRLPIAVKLPNRNAEVVQAQNMGEPIAPGGDSELAAQVRKWAAQILGVSSPQSAAAKKKGLLAWFTQEAPARSAIVREA